MLVHSFGDVNPEPLSSTAAGPVHSEAELHSRTLCAKLHGSTEAEGRVWG